MPSRTGSSRPTPRSPASGSDAPFRPWLLRIVANEARNRRRSADRRAGLAIRAAARSGGDTAVADSPESEVLAAETRDQLHAALRELRDEDREVIGARYFLGLSEAETAEALALPAGTVKSRTSRRSGGCARPWPRSREDRPMADQPFVPLHRRPDEAIEDALRLLSGEIDWPVAATSVGGPDIAAAVAARLVEEGRGTAEVGPALLLPRGDDGPGRPPVARSSWRSSCSLAFAALVGAGGIGAAGSADPVRRAIAVAVADRANAHRRPAVRRRRSRASRRRRSPPGPDRRRPARPEPGSVSGRRSPLPTSTRGRASMSSGRRSHRRPAGRRLAGPGPQRPGGPRVGRLRPAAGHDGTRGGTDPDPVPGHGRRRHGSPRSSGRARRSSPCRWATCAGTGSPVSHTSSSTRDRMASSTTRAGWSVTSCCGRTARSPTGSRRRSDATRRSPSPKSMP